MAGAKASKAQRCSPSASGAKAKAQEQAQAQGRAALQPHQQTEGAARQAQDDASASPSPSPSAGAASDPAAAPCAACAEWRLGPWDRSTAAAAMSAAASSGCGSAAAHHAGHPHALPLLAPREAPDPELRAFWRGLPISRRRELLRVTRRELFERVRGLYCSRCFGLWTFRYEELKGCAAGRWGDGAGGAAQPRRLWAAVGRS